MYKIVLVDDEDVVRKGMRDLIPWEELNLEMAGDAPDGEKGLELIETVKPHIAFLDINMPKIDGMKLTKMIREKYPDIIIVLITGYDEFSYAREALRLGVEDYILKPITREEVITLLDKIVTKLNEKQEEEKQQKAIRRKIKQSSRLMQQRYIEELILEEIEETLIIKKSQGADIPYDKLHYSIALIDYDYYIKGLDSNQNETTFFAIQNIIEELVKKNNWGLTFEINNLNGILYFTDEDDRVSDTYKERLELIKGVITEHLDIPVTIGVGKIVHKLSELHVAYETAHEALVNRFFIGTNKIITQDTYVKMPKTSHANEWLQWENKLIQSIKDPDKFHKTLEEIYTSMEQIRMPIETCQNTWNLLVSAMLKKFIQIDEGIIVLIPNIVNIMEDLKTKKTIKEIKAWVYKLYDRCSNYIEEQASPNKIHLQNITQFIDENYHIPDLSISMVCKEVHLSPSYFSTVFKKATGKTFIQFLTDYRLEKAKEMLKFTPLKTYEIAEKVGYPDAQYFSTLFKKQFNRTPSEYRKIETER